MTHRVFFFGVLIVGLIGLGAGTFFREWLTQKSAIWLEKKLESEIRQWAEPAGFSHIQFQADLSQKKLRQKKISGWKFQARHSQSIITLEGDAQITDWLPPLKIETDLQWTVKNTLGEIHGTAHLSIPVEKTAPWVSEVRAEIQIPKIELKEPKTPWQSIVTHANITASWNFLLSAGRGVVTWKSLEGLYQDRYFDSQNRLPNHWSWELKGSLAKLTSIERKPWFLGLDLNHPIETLDLNIPPQSLSTWTEGQLPPALSSLLISKGTLELSRKPGKSIHARIQKLLISSQNRSKSEWAVFIPKLNLEFDPLQKRVQWDSFAVRARAFQMKTEIPVIGQKLKAESLPDVIHLTQGFKIHPLEISIDPLVLQIKKNLAAESELFTRVTSPDQPLGNFAQALCQKQWLSFPIAAQMDFQEVRGSTASITTTGSAQLKLFGGTVKLDQLEIDDPLEAVPTTYFDVVWDEVKLSEYARFSNFGKIDGVLRGHSLDTVMEALLPIHSHFRLEIVPDRKKVIVFNSEAMKNFVTLVAADGINRIPGVAQWFAFGLPSQLLGGYNVDYVGVALSSEDGNLLLETLDPPAMQKQGKHWLLYGPRFRMPLDSAAYPVNLDPAGLTLFVERVLRQLHSLSKKEITDDNIPCDIPQIE